LNGLDDIGLTLQKSELITEFEKKRTQQWPWLDGFAYIKEGKIPTAGITKKGAKIDW
jgi:3-isopropylmalate dehydratase